MKRMTKRIGHYNYLFCCIHMNTKDCVMADPKCSIESCEECDFLGDMLNKLGRYEDTGLSPEEITELIKKKG